MWKKAGIELGVQLHKLTKIEISNPDCNVKAAKDMLKTWNHINKKVSRRTLYQTIKCCRTNKGIYPIITFSYY